MERDVNFLIAKAKRFTYAALIRLNLLDYVNENELFNDLVSEVILYQIENGEMPRYDYIIMALRKMGLKIGQYTLYGYNQPLELEIEMNEPLREVYITWTTLLRHPQRLMWKDSDKLLHEFRSLMEKEKRLIKSYSRRKLKDSYRTGVFIPVSLLQTAKQQLGRAWTTGLIYILARDRFEELFERPIKFKKRTLRIPNQIAEKWYRIKDIIRNTNCEELKQIFQQETVNKMENVKSKPVLIPIDVQERLSQCGVEPTSENLQKMFQSIYQILSQN